MSNHLCKQTPDLLDWYKQNFRELPWRSSRDPYRIWVSEIMLQQTTVTAVKPYFERFLKRFPNVHVLAASSIEDVQEMWSGLGYYSRARNMHKAAQILTKTGFPSLYSQLIELPGFGPYTARAVSSFAFNESVGVLDGNVIRFLSRFYAQKLLWWRPSEREKLQKLSDSWVKGYDSHNVNQALIEIGATICTAQTPKCLSCPVMKDCRSVGTVNIETLPLKKVKKQNEIWVWKIEVHKQGHRLALIKNSQHKKSLPVLKNSWIWPGKAMRVKSIPKTFDFKHSVTHHNIYVSVIKKSSHTKGFEKEAQWLKKSDIKKISPASLITKALLYV